MSFGPDLAKVVLNMLEQDFRFALSHYAHFSLKGTRNNIEAVGFLWDYGSVCGF